MNPFTTLGLAETATPDEVKKAYRARLHQVHPDVAGDAGHQLTIELIDAYQQALVLARSNVASVTDPVPTPGFVPAHRPSHGAWIRTSSTFVASTFHAVA